MNAVERTSSEFRRIPVSSQGQVTLPKPIRERLGVTAGGSIRINFIVNPEGQIVIEPEPTVDDLFGILKPSAAVKPANIYELREAIVDERLRELGYSPKND